MLGVPDHEVGSLTVVGANRMVSARWSTVDSGAACLRAIAHAAAIGDAIDVPPNVDVTPLSPVEVTKAPAA